MSKTIKKYISSLNIRKIVISINRIDSSSFINIEVEDEDRLFSLDEAHVCSSSIDTKEYISKKVNRICHSLILLKDDEKTILYTLLIDKWSALTTGNKLVIYGNKAEPKSKLYFYNTDSEPKDILDGLLYSYRSGVYSIYDKPLSIKKLKKRISVKAVVIPNGKELHIILNKISLKDIILYQVLYQR